MPDFFFNKVADRPATLLKRRLWHRCFPVNFEEFPRTPFIIYRTPLVAASKIASDKDSFAISCFSFLLISLGH